MVNLLPPEIKKDIHREYLFRFFAVILFLFALVMVVGSAVGLPYVFSSYLANNEISKKMVAQNPVSLASSTKDMMDRFNKFTQEIELLKPSVGHASTTDTIEMIVADRPAGVNIDSIAGRVDDKGSRILVISGIAGSRESLLQFENKLSAHKIFSAVNLPVSNFSKKTDIEYSITINISY